MANYWGYNTVGFFAPHGGYSSAGDRGGQVREFKEMVKAFHAAGIEVILDVVYNHTAEGDVNGPTLSFRGLDDRAFYHRVDHRAAGRPVRRHLLGRDRLRQHGERLRPLRPAAGARLPALLDVADARRRLPLRPRLRALPDRPRRRHGLAADDRDRAGPDAAPREADRRAVGRLGGRLPGRRVPAAVGGVERPVPRHGPRLLARPAPAASGPSRPGWPARRTCTPTTGDRRTPR